MSVMAAIIVAVRFSISTKSLQSVATEARAPDRAGSPRSACASVGSVVGTESHARMETFEGGRWLPCNGELAGGPDDPGAGMSDAEKACVAYLEIEDLRKALTDLKFLKCNSGTPKRPSVSFRLTFRTSSPRLRRAGIRAS